jgi:hypothetical protein
MSKEHRKTKKILPGDLVCDFDPQVRSGISALVVSISGGDGKEKDVRFLILGEDFLHDGVTDKEKYFLISRLEI